jgi:hypothetical protein
MGEGVAALCTPIIKSQYLIGYMALSYDIHTYFFIPYLSRQEEKDIWDGKKVWQSNHAWRVVLAMQISPGVLPWSFSFPLPWRLEKSFLDLHCENKHIGDPGGRTHEWVGTL